MFSKLLKTGVRELEREATHSRGSGGGHSGHDGRGAHAGAGAGAGMGAGAAVGAGAASHGHHGVSNKAASGKVSKHTINVAGLPVHVYGLDELTPARPGAAPEVCLVIHMHGRTGSAKKEDALVRKLYSLTQASRSQLPARSRDVIFAVFDQRNHGERETNPLGQKTWKEGNGNHAIDMYAMYRGTASDTSFIMDFLPSYLFPNGERFISLVAVTGKSLGGHAAWQVLAHEPRIRVGVPFIGTPDYQKLIHMRAVKSNLQDTPPVVPPTLRELFRNVDPAMMPYREPSPRNPFWGKKICACCGADDQLVRFSYSEEFLANLIVAPPAEQRESFEVFVQPGTGHTVTDEMLEVGARFLARWALPY